MSSSSFPLGRGSGTGFMEPPGSTQGPARLCVAVDRRVRRQGHGTGASIYAEGLRHGVQSAGFTLVDLVDAAAADAPDRSRAARWAAALWPRPVAAVPQGCGLMAADAFRRAQVHFDVYGRYLRLACAGPPPGLMHWSYPLPLRLSGMPNLYTVHDLIPLLQPDLTPIRQGRSRRLLRRLQQEAAHLVTVSETSRQEIIATLGWAPGQVTNTFQAVEPPGWSAAEEEDAVLRATETVGVARGDYFLHVGTVERRKNIARLIAAYRQSGSRRALVLAGPQGWRAAEELAEAADLLAAPGAEARRQTGQARVIWVDWMARNDLLGLLRGAAALLAPSLAEGFGLPAVEAMGLGVPALTSQAGAPGEVCGPAALLVDPLDVRALADAITALDSNAGLRAALIAAGRKRATVFSAANHASRLAELYRAVLDSAGRPLS